MTPTNWYKLTDSILGSFTELQSIDLLYGVDKSDLSQDPQGTSKRLPVGVLVNHILNQLPEYIPLSGSSESAPITGELILSDNLYIGNREVGSFEPQGRLGFEGSSSYLFTLEPGLGNVGLRLDSNPLGLDPYAVIYSNLPSFPGIEYQDDYSINFRPNTLITKQWVEDYVESLPTPASDLKGIINVSIIPVGSTVLSPAFIGDVVIPYDCKITGWYIFGTDSSGTPQVGSASINAWLDTYSNYPPTSGDSIFSGNNPVLVGQSRNALSGLDISLLEGYVLRIQLSSVSNLSRIFVSLTTEPF
jgi:hypothetical protein